MSATTLDPKIFSKDEKPNEYEASFRVHGSIRVTIHAASPEEAKAKAEAMCEDEEFGLEIDEADDVSVSHVWKSPPMFRVTREGRMMQVSRLREGDIPREPDERGF